MRKIKVVIKRPDEPIGHMAHISDSLWNLQTIVEGYIEIVRIADDMVVICNEEGRLRDLPFNCRIDGEDLVGTLIFAGVDGEEITDMPISFNSYKRMFGLGKWREA